MPRDAEYGRDIAAQITASYSGLVKDVAFTYDAFYELDRMDEDRPYCILSTNTYSQIRESRAMWRETIQILLTMVSAVGPTDNEVWVDQWLDSWDMMIRGVREMKVLGKHKPLSIDLDERYDADMFHNNRRLVTQAVLNFGNVEVI